jgi:hypothetical protein
MIATIIFLCFQSEMHAALPRWRRAEPLENCARAKRRRVDYVLAKRAREIDLTDEEVDAEMEYPTKRVMLHDATMQITTAQQQYEYQQRQKCQYLALQMTMYMAMQNERDRMRLELLECEKDAIGIGACKLNYWKLNRLLLGAEMARRARIKN